MGSTPDHRRPWWQRPWVRVAATLVPAAAVLWLSHEASGWLSGVLANAGVTVLLFVPAALYADWHKRALRDVTARSDEAVRTSRQAEAIAEETRVDVGVLSDAVERMTGADAIEAELNREQLAELARDSAIFDRWGVDADRESTVAALSYGLQVGLISAVGYRAPIFETNLHLRFTYDSTNDDLTLVVERDDATPVGSVEWSSDRAAIDVYRTIEKIVTESGQRPAPWALSTHAVKQAADALSFAVQERSMPIMHGNNFRRVVEFTGTEGDEQDGWYITERGLFPRENLGYVVAIGRLNETLWENHLTDKGWYGAPRALAIARALNGITNPLLRSEAASLPERQD